ncbi:MAG: aldo/keto reductase [Flavobacteriales bacterium]|nr:aldo/keto reductase [Flavobacteriales bacterium]
MKKVKLADHLEISPLVHGHWRLLDWKLSDQELLKLTQQIVELGITTFDHADIYGNYECEKQFGNALAIKKALRNKIKIVSKCGIKLVSDKFPERQIGYYDYRYEHIISSVNNSLANFRTDYIDLLLLHRPSPFFNPEEVAKAFSHLKQSGKVLHFGVSNFNPRQYEMLSSYVDDPLVTNQVEISPFCLEHFDNGNMDFFLEKRIKPMAWSPLAGGKLINPEGEKGQRIFKCLAEVADELDIEHIDKIIYCWLLKHPAHIIPIIGSGKISRIENAIEALDIDMSMEQWMKIYIASVGKKLP